MTTKTLRLPDALAAAVHDVGAAEHIEDSAAMRKLLHMGYAAYIAERYRAGRMSLREAARRMEMSLGDALDALRQLGVSGNATADDTLHAFRSLSTSRPGSPA
jgi:hypothetical protein